MSLTITTIVAYLTLASLILTIKDVKKLKEENRKIKREMELIKKDQINEPI